MTSARTHRDDASTAHYSGKLVDQLVAMTKKKMHTLPLALEGVSELRSGEA